MRMRQDSSCSWSIGHCSSFVCILVSVFLSVSIFPERGDSLEAVSPPLSLPFFPLFYQCDGCLFSFSFHVGAQGWVAWICQPWEQFPSRSWLLIVQAPGCLNLHFTSSNLKLHEFIIISPYCPQWGIGPQLQIARSILFT